MNGSLDHPDDDSWQSAPDYAPELADALRSAYAIIAKTHRSSQRIKGFRRAKDLVAGWRDKPVCKPQRLRVLHVLALCNVALSAYDAAFDDLQAALDIATELDDRSAFAEIAYLYGALRATTFQYQEARSYYRASFDTLHEEDPSGRISDPDVEIAVLVGWAGCDFVLERYEHARELLDEARKLLAGDDIHLRDAATVEWVAALMERWHGEPGTALNHAMRSTDMFADLPLQIGFVQVHIVTVECALDLAGQFSPATHHFARRAYASLASQYTKRAMKIARRLRDESLVSWAHLAGARLDRICGRPGDRRAIIQNAQDTAERLGDTVLQVRALTELGDERRAQGDEGGARSAYRDAVELADRAGIPAMGVWAQRALDQQGNDDG